jgi:subtilisin family serine protease
MKSESVWKILAISIIILMVASAAGAVNMARNSANDDEDKALGPDDTSSTNTHFIPVYKHTKMSPEVIMSIPPPVAGPLTPMIVKIYLIEEDPAYIAELKPYVIEMLNEKEDVVRAMIYTNRITDIAGLEFVSYVDMPLYSNLEKLSVNEDSFTPVYKHPKMSPNVIQNIPPPIGGPLTPMIVKIYTMEEDPAYIAELKPYVIEMLNEKEDVVRAKIYTNRITDIAGLDFVSYVDELDGYEELQERGELPKNMTVMSFRADGNITGGGEIHGTACAEIIHDVAPDAELFLVNYIDDMEFEDALDWLIEQHVDVVSHSAGMLVGLFDGTDSWDKKIDETVEDGVVWANSAGNSADRHWEGGFYDPDENGYHNFNGEDESLSFFVERGYYLGVWLSWNDSWRNATQDYDMEIFDPTLQYRVVSDREQNGKRGDIPIEMIGFYAPVTGYYHAKIYRYSATRDAHFEIYTPYNSPEYIVQNSSLCGYATANKSLTVGAFNCTSWEVMSYSSRGLTNDGRAKPDIVAPTEVSNYAYLNLPERSRFFGGTSAAAPHVAGAAALLLSKNSSITPDEIKELLIENALPILPPVPSNVTGYGLVNLTFATE